MRRFIWMAAGLLAAGTASLALATSGSGSAAPHPVTAEQARRLALVRFRVYETAPAAVTATVPAGIAGGAGSRTTTVRAVVDYRRHRAVGSYAETPGGGAGLLAWDGDGLAVAHSGVVIGSATEAADAARALPRPAWTRRDWAGGPLDTALRLMLALGANRPDDVRRPTRSGPMWLRDERIGGRSYGVFSVPRPRAPATLTYWLDGNGGLRRARSRPADGGRPLTVDFIGVRLRTTVPRVR